MLFSQRQDRINNASLSISKVIGLPWEPVGGANSMSFNKPNWREKWMNTCTCVYILYPLPLLSLSSLSLSLSSPSLSLFSPSLSLFSPSSLPPSLHYQWSMVLLLVHGDPVVSIPLLLLLLHTRSVTGAVCNGAERACCHGHRFHGNCCRGHQTKLKTGLAYIITCTCILTLFIFLVTPFY